MTTSTPGLRERKKAETRQAVNQAALRLVAEHGFDRVTVEDIAEAANVSRRTFFNYFADKADAVMYGERQRYQTLLATFRARPAAEPSWEALRRTADELYGAAGDPDREWVLRTRLARRHPSLLARQLADLDLLERELAQAIAERDDDPGLRPRVLAGTYLTTLRIASLIWLENDQARSLAETATAALDELGRSFGG